MSKYNFIKEFITKHNNLNVDDFDNLIIKSSFDDDLKILLLLCHNHGFAFHSLIIKYLPDNTNNYSYIYFRFFYYFYVLIKHVYDNYNSQNIKEIFLNFLRYSRKFKYHSDIKLYDEIVNKFTENYDYLYDTFFEKDNVYFNTYFNNLIKYFLPLPYDFLLYAPLITYRNNVTKFYKKNDDDPIEITQSLNQKRITETTETTETTENSQLKRFTGIKNVNIVNKEIDIHIPLKYFHNKKQNEENDKVFLIVYKINNKFVLLIANNVTTNVTNNVTIDDKFSVNGIKYKRNFTQFDNNKYNIGYPLQLIFDKWVKTDNDNIEINKNDVTYISIMRKITSTDLFNVFSKMNLSIDNYSYLFHNTSYQINSENLNHILTNPSFFYFIPHGSKSYADSYFKNRRCNIFKIKNNIDNLIDLTQSIITNNPFTNNHNLQITHSKQKIWKGYDVTKIMDYYDNKEIPLTTNDNYKCVTFEKNQDINKFIKNRPYCDIGTKKMYVGRRKLYEIVLKTRKYNAPSIWPMKYLSDLYNKHNIKVNETDYEDQIYNSPEKIKANVTGYLYDIIFLKTLGYNGFFFTDFDVAFSYGGELMLTNAKNYIGLYKYSLDTCDKNIQLHDANYKQSRQTQSKSTCAYVTLLMGNNSYFIGALVFGYSLKKNTNNDLVIMVTPDVPNEQKNILSEIYDVVLDIDFITINKSLIKNYDTNRFKDIFTKLQCLTLIQYEKIIMIDIDMLVLKNMDNLFALDAPAATLRKVDMQNGEKIPKKLIVKNNELVGGINAGLVLFKPNIEEYKSIVNELITLSGTEYSNPEQDYLSMKYANNWTNISFLYNFQFGLTKRTVKYNPKDIFNLHYSSRLKPWRIIHKPDETWVWINETPQNIVYYKMWMATYEKINKKYLNKNVDLNKLYKHD